LVIASAVHARIVRAPSDEDAVLIRIGKPEVHDQIVYALKQLPDVADAVWAPDLYRTDDADYFAVSEPASSTSYLVSKGDSKQVELKSPSSESPDWWIHGALVRSIILFGTPTFVAVIGLYVLVAVLRRRRSAANHGQRS
jgi:uncharacterized protein (TIGR03382 family)